LIDLVRTSNDYWAAREAVSQLTWEMMRGGITRHQLQEINDGFHERWGATIAAAQRAVSIPPLPPGRYYGD